MNGLYTNELYAIVLFEGNPLINPAEALATFRLEMEKRGLPTTSPHQTLDFVLILGPDELFITVTSIGKPLEADILAPTLNSLFTKMICADGSQHVQGHSSHVLVEVRNGHSPGMPLGHSLNEFKLRADVMGEICCHLAALPGARAVYWPISNELVPAEKFDTICDYQHPNMLMVHPRFYFAESVPGYEGTPMGFVTLGVIEYLGREIVMSPAPVPYWELQDGALVFIRMMLGGYVFPHGSVFGPDDKEYLYQVEHIDDNFGADALQEPHYRLTLLHSKEHTYSLS